jgi:hypothetical protein
MSNKSKSNTKFSGLRNFFTRLGSRNNNTGFVVEDPENATIIANKLEEMEEREKSGAKQEEPKQLSELCISIRDKLDKIAKTRLSEINKQFLPSVGIDTTKFKYHNTSDADNQHHYYYMMEENNKVCLELERLFQDSVIKKLYDDFVSK